MAKRIGDLEIVQDLDEERREWRVERIARVVLFGLIVGALAGLFGPGPMSWTEETDGALTVSYERFTRRGGTSTLSVEVDGEQAESGRFDVRVERSYLSNFRISNITPTPDSVRTSGRFLTYTFTTDRPSEGLMAAFAVTPEGLWAADGVLALPNGDTVRPSHFIYP